MATTTKEDNRCDVCGAYMQCCKEPDTENWYWDIYFQCKNRDHYKHKEDKEINEMIINI
jgi:hypothetical protein